MEKLQSSIKSYVKSQTYRNTDENINDVPPIDVFVNNFGKPLSLAEKPIPKKL